MDAGAQCKRNHGTGLVGQHRHHGTVVRHVQRRIEATEIDGLLLIAPSAMGMMTVVVVVVIRYFAGDDEPQLRVPVLARVKKTSQVAIQRQQTTTVFDLNSRLITRHNCELANLDEIGEKELNVCLDVTLATQDVIGVSGLGPQLFDAVAERVHQRLDRGFKQCQLPNKQTQTQLLIDLLSTSDWRNRFKAEQEDTLNVTSGS